MMIKRRCLTKLVSVFACFGILAPSLSLAARADSPTNVEGYKLAQVSSAPDAGTLSAGAREVAQLLGVLPQVETLIHLEKTRTTADMSDEELALKVRLLDKILGESLEVRTVADRIDRELSWSYTSLGMLQAKRQKTLNYLFSANFMQGGILGITAGGEFLHGENKTGSTLLLIGSSVGLSLSILAFLEQRSGSKRIDGETTILTETFGLQPPPDQQRPDIVIKFLNSVPPGGTKTRREELLESWKRGKYLRSMEERQLNRLAAIQNKRDSERENIPLLGSRIRMLFDTQWTVEKLDEELLDLLRATDIN